MLNTSVPRVAPGTIERASFTGSAGEYFGIWIVNVILTILTLGIYSAWAKVRRTRYFYGNTVIRGHAFEYHASGKQILIGRLIVVAAVIVLNVLAALHPFLSLGTSLAVLLALPWLLRRSLRFNARVTSYRNVRFDFVGTTGGAFRALIAGGLLSALSLGLLAPVASRWLWRYLVNHLRYGDRRLATSVTLGALYRVWLLPAFLVIVGLAALVVIVLLAVAAAAAQADGAVLAAGLPYLLIVVVFLVYAMAGMLYQIGVRNAVLSATLLDGRHALVSDAPRLRYVWIAVSNTVVTLLTLGLMRPWAAVRMARFLCDRFAIRVDGDIDDVVAAIQTSGSAFSAEYLDLEGFDFGF